MYVLFSIALGNSTSTQLNSMHKKRKPIDPSARTPVFSYSLKWRVFVEPQPTSWLLCFCLNIYFQGEASNAGFLWALIERVSLRLRPFYCQKWRTKKEYLLLVNIGRLILSKAENLPFKVIHLYVYYDECYDGPTWIGSREF